MGVYGSAGVLDSRDIDADTDDGAIIVWVVNFETEWEGTHFLGVARTAEGGKKIAENSFHWKDYGHDWYYDEGAQVNVCWQRWQDGDYFLVEEMEVED